MTAYLAVLFDVDETLYDRTRAQPMILRNIMTQLPELFAGQAEEEVFAAYERSDALTAEHGLTHGSIRASRNRRTRIFLEELGLNSEAAVEAVTEQYVAAYRCVDTPIDGAVQVVEGCARNHRVGVISNAFSDVQYHKLESIGLPRNTFEFVLLSEDIGIRKPEDASCWGSTPGKPCMSGIPSATTSWGPRRRGWILAGLTRGESRRRRTLRCGPLWKSALSGSCCRSSAKALDPTASVVQQARFAASGGLRSAGQG